MTASDAFVSDSTHSYDGNCYFVHVDPNLAQLIRDAATVVARVTSSDNQGDEAWVDSLVQRAQDALPAPTPADSEDDEAAPRPAQDTPEFKATKRDLVQQLVARLQERGAKLQALADRDFVGFSNSFLSLLLETQQGDELNHGIEVLVGAIACKDPKPATTQPALSTRYSTLATIFNALPSTTRTPLRLQVLRTLVKYAAENDDVAIVKPALDPLQLEQYFADAADEKEADETAASLVQSLLNNVGGGNGSAKAATDPIGTVTLAREILVARLSSASSSPASSPVRSKLAATLIALLLASNDVYDFTPYRVNLPAASDSEEATCVLAETFKRFTDPSSSGEQADDFASQDELDKAVASTTLFPSSSSSPSSSSPESASSESASTPASARTASSSAQLLRVDRAHLVQKQTLLRFARLCEDKGVGKSVRYDEIAKRLGLLSASAGGGGGEEDEGEEEEGEEVETWVIDAIRASLVQGRLSQPTQSFLITRVAPLSFSSSSSSGSTSSWQVIQERLEGWKGALDRVTATVEKSLAVSGGSGASRGGRFGAEEIVNHHHQQQAVEA